MINFFSWESDCWHHLNIAWYQQSRQFLGNIVQWLLSHSISESEKWVILWSSRHMFAPKIVQLGRSNIFIGCLFKEFVSGDLVKRKPTEGGNLDSETHLPSTWSLLRLISDQINHAFCNIFPYTLPLYLPCSISPS